MTVVGGETSFVSLGEVPPTAHGYAYIDDGHKHILVTDNSTIPDGYSPAAGDKIDGTSITQSKAFLITQEVWTTGQYNIIVD